MKVLSRKKLKYQLFPSYLVIIIIVVFALIWFTNRSLQGFYYKEKEKDLEARAILVGQKVSADKLKDMSYLTKLCRDLGQATGTRITIISAMGKVLGDSHESPEIMDYHGDRPEVVGVSRGNVGTSIRYSHTLEQEMMYLAVSVKTGKNSIIVRTSLPITSLQETISATRKEIIFGGIIIAFMATLVNFFVSRRIARPLEEMKRGAERFASGELNHKLAVPGTEEIGALATTLNQMASQLDKRIKTILRQHNEQEAVLSSMVEGVLAVDGEERIISLNAAAAKLLKIDRTTALNRSIQVSVRNTELHKFIGDVLSGKNYLETELVFLSPTNRHLKVTGTVLHEENGEQIGAVIVLNDISKIRHLENIRRDFVANVSHELKTPITAIKGFVETLQDGAAGNPNELERFLAVIARQADRLNAIIDNLLELSRIEQEEEKSDILLELKPVRPVLEGAVQDCREQAGREQIIVTIACDVKLAAPLHDPLLQQALLNLIENAIKYSDSGREVLVTAKQVESEVVIAVQDFGRGIAAKHFERLFERFYRVDKARSRKLGGTGLGLAIVKHIAKVHGGSVSVQSTLGKGSTFSINLPRKLM